MTESVKDEIKKLKEKVKKLALKKKKEKKEKKPRKVRNAPNLKLNTTLPASIKPLTAPQGIVSGHFDKNDAKDIEKLQSLTNKIQSGIRENENELSSIRRTAVNDINQIKEEVKEIQEIGEIKEAIEKKKGRPMDNCIDCLTFGHKNTKK